MAPTACRFLAEPRVTFDRLDGCFDGPVTSAYVVLRDGVKAVRMVQPSRAALVFVLMAADELPIGIRLHEPADGAAVCRMLSELIESPGRAEAASGTRGLTADEIKAAVDGVERSIEGLRLRS